MRNAPIQVAPMDTHNREMVDLLHPGDWVNPRPDGRYNLVIIGAGPAGLIVAAGAAGLGAKVALIEKHLMGGDCLNVGCVPSKSVISPARVVQQIRSAGDFGIRVSGDSEVDFQAVMERMRRIRAGISHHDSVSRYQNELGVDVYLGAGAFSGPDTVEVEGQTLRFRKAVIATGARAFVPPVEGLAESGYLTNETVFNLTELPPRLAVLGGGPIGCELAQAFLRFGSEVFLFQNEEQILNREDPDAAQIVRDTFLREGMQLLEGCTVDRVQFKGSGKLVRFVRSNGEIDEIEVDAVLVGAGRAPNVEHLNLESVGVEYDTRAGIKVNDRLQTTNPRLFAAGDVCMRYRFTHAADAAARIVIQNALFWGRKKLSALTIPWCTYTDPEIAHVGLSEHEASQKGVALDVYKHNLADTDRGAADGVTEGFAKIVTEQGKDRILGATIVGEHAGDMLNEITLAMTAGLGLGRIGNVIHPYPTQAEAIKRCADAYSRTRLTPTVKRVLSKILAWQR